MSTTVWCDGSANSETIAAACYCQETGKAIVRRYPATVVARGRHSDWAEIKAIALAITELKATKVYTDNRSIAELASTANWGVNPRARLYAEILQLITSAKCQVEWVSRDFNTMADWLSKCPQDANFELQPGLVPTLKQGRFKRNIGENIDRSGGKTALYQELITSGTEADFRQADAWMLEWLRRDALSWREGNLGAQRLREDLNAAKQQAKGAKAELKKANQCSSRYYLEIQKLRSLLGMEQAG